MLQEEHLGSYSSSTSKKGKHRPMNQQEASSNSTSVRIDYLLVTHATVCFNRRTPGHSSSHCRWPFTANWIQTKAVIGQYPDSVFPTQTKINKCVIGKGKKKSGKGYFFLEWHHNLLETSAIFGIRRIYYLYAKNNVYVGGHGGGWLQRGLMRKQKE